MKKLNILYEDKHLVIIDKESGKLTIGTLKDKTNTLYREVYSYLHKKNQKVFIVHRLDKETSGIVLFAKSDKVKNELQTNWDAVIRKYIAVVEGKVEDKERELVDLLSETKTHLVYVSNYGDKAITKYKVIKSKNNSTVLDIEIKTGKKNQIRVQLANINHPIIGDNKYGKKKYKTRLLLHANFISFKHPITKELLSIECKLPKEFK